MKSWKSTIGGALSALGTALVGVGVIPQLGGVPSKVHTHIALAGFILSSLGKFFAHLFSADASELRKIRSDVAESKEAIITGDTTTLQKQK